jgi:hypothetical protein
VRETRLIEHRTEALRHTLAVPPLDLGPGDAFGGILGVELEWPPIDFGAELALKPRRAFQADVAERSYVVAPHEDPRRLARAIHPHPL